MDLNPKRTLESYLRSLDNKYDHKKIAALKKATNNSIGNKKVLDLGCGGGLFSIWMAKNGAEVWGVDIDEEKIAAAKLYAQREGVTERCKFITADVCEVKIEEKFDIILAKDIIEHVDDNVFMQNIRRHSKSNTVLMVSTHNWMSLQYLIMASVYYLFGKGQYLGTDPEHLRMYSPMSLRKVVEKYGFKTHKWIGCYHIPYRLLKGIIPIWILDFFPFHILEAFRSIFPFNRTGWSITAMCNSIEKD